MCRDFGIQPAWLGVYTSVINASFGFCQFLVSYLWGYMSDLYGRRNILLCGLTGTFIAMILFGFSTDFTMALISRCITGTYHILFGILLMVNTNLHLIVTYFGLQSHNIFIITFIQDSLPETWECSRLIWQISQIQATEDMHSV